MIESYLVEVNSYHDHINEIICNRNFEEQLEDLYGHELDSQADCTLDIQNKISSFSVCAANNSQANRKKYHFGVLRGWGVRFCSKVSWIIISVLSNDTNARSNG